MTDIHDWHETDRLHAEQGQGDPFAAAVRATRMPMIITDPRLPDNPIVFANSAFLSLSGYSRDEVIGRNCRILQGTETDPVAIQSIRNAIAEPHDLSIDILNYRKDGSRFWNGLYLSPVTTAAGEVQFFFASQLDVSDRVEAQLQINSQKEMLEREVSRRTKDLREALAAKTMLVHEVDHRVKNNLQMISSLLAMQSRTVKDPEAQYALKGTLQRIEAIGSVHRRLYQSDNVQHFDIGDFVRDIAIEMKKASGREEVALKLDVQSVQMSSQQAASIALMLNEMMTNALKHAFPDGRSGTLSIQLKAVEERLAITLLDDGIGMPSSCRVENFGLRLVKTISRQLGANVQWRSGDPGTIIEINVPLSAKVSEHV